MYEEKESKKDEVISWIQMPFVLAMLCLLIFSLVVYSPMAFVLLLGAYIIYSILNNLRDNPVDQ